MMKQSLMILSAMLAIAITHASGEAPVSLSPRINGPSVYGARPGNPFLYRIPCTGARPMKFAADALPASLKLDTTTGIITGTTPERGEYKVTLRARNNHGSSERSFKIVAGDKLALTPPMGWNHWYAHFNRITDEMMREAADIMVSSGMADAGYQYVNVDDCWMNAKGTSKYQTDPKRVGPTRDTAGNVVPNVYFPDMKGLADYIHSKGLKAGIYTSPGASTCSGFTGSLGHEAQDAKLFADWGFDFLKYDWCSYGRVAGKNPDLAAMQKPFRLMGELLQQQNRDIVFNLCQYGMGDVWKWGAEVGGHSWRTGGDLGFELNRIFEIALKNCALREFNKPGAWNDPDYIQIGWIGAQRDGKFLPSHPCLLTPEEQRSFMSLWCLMASPLFYSGDMTKLDAVTLSILCNPEAIDVNQDPLGECARVVGKPGKTFVLVKNMEDGSQAVGLCNRDASPQTVAITWADLSLAGKLRVRDIWRQKDFGQFEKKFETTVPPRSVVFLRLFPAPTPTNAERDARLAWWREARFGMFIHWGIFAIPAGEWNGKMVEGNVEWIKAKAKIPDAEYDKLAGQFNPTQFNADEWAQLAQEAGMKYLVFVAKHHDGFAMYHSKADRYNVVDATPWKRDPAKELADACARHGIKFCVYYSHNLDWNDPNATASRDQGPGSAHDFGKYMRDKALPQVKELLTGYGPLGLIWFDMSGGMTREQAQPFADLVRSLQPQCLINSRVSKGLVESDYLTKGDHSIPTGVGTAPWETPDTVTDFWGYKKNDPTTKTPAQLVFNLVDVVSKGGNYLLNVGPTAAGVIPQPSVDSLRGVGRWMKVNGEAIYGCGATAFGSELGRPSPTEKEPKTGKPKFIEAREWRCTTKPGKLYIHIFQWPATGKLELPAMEKIVKAYWLADVERNPVRMEQTDTGVSLSLPAKAPDTIASVLCLETAP